MKKFFCVILLSSILACNSQSNNSIGKDGSAAAVKNADVKANSSSADNCTNNLAFKKGSVIETSSYDGQGQVTSKQISTVTKVYTKDGMTISELAMKSQDEKGANEKMITALYKCDGKKFFIDLSGIVPGADQGADIKTSGLEFPFNVSEGETLPDYDYSMIMKSGGNSRKITSHIKERKVEAKESVTTPAGTFECYKISAVIETDLNMPDMDEASKKVMEEVKKKMGKNKMTFWYAPEITIIKMEFHMGEKLVTRSEVTSIK